MAEEVATIENPRKSGLEIIWEPQSGSQELFLTCPIFECCYEGTRGPGKTDALLMDFAQYVGRGFGAAWRGILFREEYPNLDDVITKSKKWFYRIFPGAVYNQSDHRWTFETGETLLFRHAKREDDYWKYHGHEYPWVAWDELTNWADDKLYLKMMSICRSSSTGMPRHYRATCNPYGRGHNWVKARFIDPAPRGFVIQDEEGRERVCLHGSIYENKILLQSDPDYLKNLQAQTGAIRAAWLEGDWNIIAGGMFDDVWDESIHVMQPFDIPSTWRIDRSFDWGSSKPYSVGWWAESDGCDIVLRDGTKKSTRRGDLFRVAEMYGCNGKPNEGTRELSVEVARKILDFEKKLGRVVEAGPADSSIFDVEDGKSIANEMGRIGVHWLKADKKPGSRRNGWEIMRERFKNSISKEGPGLFVFSTCRDFIRTVPVLSRADNEPDDVDTDCEDHIGDETRYRVSSKVYRFKSS